MAFFLLLLLLVSFVGVCTLIFVFLFLGVGIILHSLTRPPQFDVIVLGSGIAGSTTALSLASQGMRVCLLENKSHPRYPFVDRVRSFG